MEISVEDVRAELPIKTIPTIIGKPTYQAINELREALYANASAIPMTLSGGRNGNVGLIMDTEFYANLPGTPYKIPTEPGPYATHGAGDMAAARDDANKIHRGERRLYNLDKT